jgi:hypothetical protein
MWKDHTLNKQQQLHNIIRTPCGIQLTPQVLLKTPSKIVSDRRDSLVDHRTKYSNTETQRCVECMQNSDLTAATLVSVPCLPFNSAHQYVWMTIASRPTFEELRDMIALKHACAPFRLDHRRAKRRSDSRLQQRTTTPNFVLSDRSFSISEVCGFFSQKSKTLQTTNLRTSQKHSSISTHTHTRE